MQKITTGNALADADKGWFVGSFIDPSLGLRFSNDVEIKWDTYKAGEERPGWATDEVRTTITLLISGEWEMIFRDRTVVLVKPGDYVIWGIGVDHKWRALKDSTMLTVRWPSIRKY